MTDGNRAKVLYECFNQRFHIDISWDQCDDEVRSFWLKTIEDCDEIGKGIIYAD